jgi:hypothetical protein
MKRPHDPPSRQLSDDARPPPREAVFRFGDKLSMTNKSPSPTTNATPEDKLRTLLQDQALRNAQRKRDAGTFLSHTHSDEGGRYSKPQQIVGSAPVPEYPRQPDGSFSNQAAVVGPEESLGFDINETPIVGESWEIEASVRALDEAAAPATEASDISSLDVVAVERKGDAAPTETSSSNFPPAPSQKLAASPNQPIPTRRKPR